MKRLTKAILATLVYHDLFDYPLKKEEINKFLIEVKTSKTQLNQQLKTLVKNKLICKKSNFYFLPNRNKTVVLRKQREKYSQFKLAKAKKMARFLSLIPSIKIIAVSGALAMNNAGKNDDIDFFIITSKNRLWLTRLLLAILLEILGQRRKPRAQKIKDIKDKICLNMFLDEQSLVLDKRKRNLFTAHEIAQVQPLFNKDNAYERFLIANLWGKDYLPQAFKIKDKKIKNQKQLIVNKKYMQHGVNYSISLLDLLLNLLEKVAYRFQLKYMQSKQTIEQVSPHMAFFHPQDQARLVLKKYGQKLQLMIK